TLAERNGRAVHRTAHPGDRLAAVDRPAEHVHHPAEELAAHGHRERTAGRLDARAARDPAGRTERQTAGGLAVDVGRDLELQPSVRDQELAGRRHGAVEADVDDRSPNGDDDPDARLAGIAARTRRRLRTRFDHRLRIESWLHDDDPRSTSRRPAAGAPGELRGGPARIVRIARASRDRISRSGADTKLSRSAGASGPPPEWEATSRSGLCSTGVRVTRGGI